MISSTIYALLFSFAAVYANAIPLRHALEERDVISPPITSPDASTVWNVGETVTVTWDMSALPPNTNVTGYKGKVVLGYSTWASENLMIDTPLAQNFLLSDGHVSFTVPSVPTRNNYIVDLFGDSGNISRNFTIIGTSDSLTAAASTSVDVTATTAASVSVTVTTEVSMAVTTVPMSSTESDTMPSAHIPSNVPSGTSLVSSALTASSVPSVSTASAVSPSSSSISAASDNNGDKSGAMSLIAARFFHPSLVAAITTLTIVML